MAPVFYLLPQRERRRRSGVSIWRGYMMLLIAAIPLPMLTLVAIVVWSIGIGEGAAPSKPCVS